MDKPTIKVTYKRNLDLTRNNLIIDDKIVAQDCIVEEVDTHRKKVGDGISSYTELPYVDHWYLVNNTDFSASVGSQLFVDTTTQSLTITLPIENIFTGDTVTIVNIERSWVANNVLIDAGSNLIQPISGLSEEVILIDTNHYKVTFLFTGTKWLMLCN